MAFDPRPSVTWRRGGGPPCHRGPWGRVSGQCPGAPGAMVCMQHVGVEHSVPLGNPRLVPVRMPGAGCWRGRTSKAAACRPWTLTPISWRCPSLSSLARWGIKCASCRTVGARHPLVVCFLREGAGGGWLLEPFSLQNAKLTARWSGYSKRHGAHRAVTGGTEGPKLSNVGSRGRSTHGPRASARATPGHRAGPLGWDAGTRTSPSGLPGRAQVTVALRLSSPRGRRVTLSVGSRGLARALLSEIHRHRPPEERGAPGTQPAGR